MKTKNTLNYIFIALSIATCIAAGVLLFLSIRGGAQWTLSLGLFLVICGQILTLVGRKLNK